ncbi:MAG: putative lipid II flippase FtsW [Oscillospiraceae bacterium]|nr:putative lipid II flippase FtsW [Oscillospiraceae bacterium]
MEQAQVQQTERPRRGPIDIPFASFVIMLTIIGVIMMFSASYVRAQEKFDMATYWFLRQGLFAVAGAAIMFVISFMDYQYFRMMSLPVMLAAMIFMVLVPFIGLREGDAIRWINLGPFSFQPSEIAKLGVIMMFATLIAAYKEKMRTFRHGVLPFVAILGLLSFLLYLQKHYSGTIIILLLGAVLMFAGGTHWGWFIGVFTAGGAAVWYMITQTTYAADRINIWLDPFKDPRGDGYQAIQSLYALGSGGPFGVGLGNSRQKHLYLPEEHNDFVFAIVGEELGFIGACLIMLIYIALILRGYWIAVHARDRFGSLLVTGVVTLLAIQVILNIGVVSTLLPTTGISLPFFSYGGTSLIIQLAQMGIVLSVSRHMPAPKSG